MNINGILVPIVTPFDNNGNVDAQKLKVLVEAFIDKGVAGIVACGTTGEYYTFSAAERELVLTTIAEAAKDKVTLIAGINSLSTDHSIELAAQAKALGYDGLMLSATPYSLPEQDGIIAHFEKIADASELPIIMYNFPARVGVAIEFDTVAHLAKHPNIVGVKKVAATLVMRYACCKLILTTLRWFVAVMINRSISSFGVQRAGLQVQPTFPSRASCTI